MIRWTEIHSDVSLSENRPEMGKLNKNIYKNCIMDLKIGILVMAIGMVVVGMTASSVSATNNCAAYVGSCQGSCSTTGQCGSGEYSGLQTGCDNGESSITIDSYVYSAHTYLQNRGYSQTASIVCFGTSYTYDYTKRVDADGDCRWEAVRSQDDHYVTSKDGPEPNPQPVLWPNNNADLWNPFGCEKNTIEAWHNGC
ncbi:hypothetical protein MSIBF_A2020036 [groundwater metagenome]|uniref:Uncharacterized protein n=1 Tax=groundwater metagenome TaxID=717931 RepID=A0A098E9M3_9ZZZZ